VRRTNLTTLILDQLRQYVIAHNLSEHDRLPPERDLAIHLNVSRPSLRNALDWLATRGALRRVQGGGTFLEVTFLEIIADSPEAQTDRPEATQIIEARWALEPAVARLAAERISAAELETLTRDLHRAELRLDNPQLFRQADLKFHLRLAQASGNSILAASVESLLNHVLALWAAEPDTDRRAIHADHVAILDAVARRDPELAERRMRAHIESFGRNVGYGLVKIGA